MHILPLLIIINEGCYIPFNWKDDFSLKYLENIKYCCLILSENYINKNLMDIKRYANVVEKRIEDNISVETIITDNIKNLDLAQKNKVDFILIDKDYNKKINDIISNL